ncbi:MULTISPECIES: beta-N-acetylhexosaminidase [Rhodomicrobium]|uniref:beta-N-acetylhexosaminidase n=1 Tax=Rhodomicrobium TaxID=1068 RepID=UPI001AEC7B02|nr:MULTISPECIES: beta-N-acetylhexosaminidase [Rhodomicrobium]
MRAFISGCEGLSLTAGELGFFRDARPCGLILFKRNCGDADQIRRLVGDFLEAVGDERALVLIDQEGGRVQRLAPPNWRRYPAGRRFGDMHAADPEKALEAARLGARMIARDLLSLGINVNCAPVLDVPAPGAHDVIGDRAYGAAVADVTALGRAVAEGYLESGVLPVIKHIPGHGRAEVDSHKSLPVIKASRAELSRTDFAPFHALRDMPLGMTAHIVISDIDPDRPASASPIVIADIIRGEIGFDGLLMCDDLGMHALSGDMTERARAVLAAGCDVALHCGGDMQEMQAVAAVAPELGGEAMRRFDAALDRLTEPQPFDVARAEILLSEVVGEIA